MAARKRRPWADPKIMVGYVRLTTGGILVFTALADLAVRRRVPVDTARIGRGPVRLVPGSALFREAGEWKVFAVAGGRARKTRVATGIRDGRYREVVVFPPDDLTDGAPVEPSGPS